MFKSRKMGGNRKGRKKEQREREGRGASAIYRRRMLTQDHQGGKHLSFFFLCFCKFDTSFDYLLFLLGFISRFSGVYLLSVSIFASLVILAVYYDCTHTQHKDYEHYEHFEYYDSDLDVPFIHNSSKLAIAPSLNQSDHQIQSAASRLKPQGNLQRVEIAHTSTMQRSIPLFFFPFYSLAHSSRQMNIPMGDRPIPLLRIRSGSGNPLRNPDLLSPRYVHAQGEPSTEHRAFSTHSNSGLFTIDWALALGGDSVKLAIFLPPCVGTCIASCGRVTFSPFLAPDEGVPWFGLRE